MKTMFRVASFVMIPTVVMIFASAAPAIGASICSDSGTPGTGPALDVEPPLASPGDDRVLASDCTATADCGVHGQIMCSGSNTCTAQDRSCTFGGSLNGFVECDGVRTDCPTDSSCSQACMDDFNECTASCTTLIPCVNECGDNFSFCTCNC